MTIVPIPLQNSSSVVEYFKKGGQVEIPRPEQCFYEPCRLKEPLRKNGSYARQVIYWGFCFLVEILRFRCKRCGRTASCPYGWLVPYHQFSAEVIAAGIETCAGEEVSYRDLSVDLCDLELVEPERDIRAQELYRELVQENTAKPVPFDGACEPRCRPAHTTIFNWVNFACKRIEVLLMQLQKELVQEKKRGIETVKLPPESLVENPNTGKAISVAKCKMLNRLSFLTHAASQLELIGPGRWQWDRLRAYFLTKAESRKDVLTDAWVRLPITQTFGLVIF